jgi:preprotein translocase subunit SecG
LTVTLFVAIHVLICVFLIAVILIQPGKGDAGIGFGSSSQSIFGSKGAGNFLTKTTSICALIFLLTSFLLTRSRMQEYNRSVIKASPAPEVPATGTDKADTSKAAPAPEANKADTAAKSDAKQAEPAKKAGTKKE